MISPTMLTQRPLSFFLTACFAVLIFSGCNGSKAFVKRAAKMEEAGMTPQAANLYYTAVIKKPTNVDAMVGLKRTGQIVLAQHISSFDQAVMNHQREGALDAWHDAEAWDNKLEAVGVNLAFPEAKRPTYETVKNAHLDESYRKANALLEEEAFDEALREFDAILELDGTYEDAQALRVVAYCEPKYRSGAEAQEAERFREAYRKFGEVVDEDASYKDASERRQAALEEGRFTVALVEFKNGSSLVNLEVKVQSMVEQRLMDTDDPFLKVVDRESLGLILQEQNMGMNGLTSGGDVELGNILGAKALLKATITTANHSMGPLTSSKRTGYEQYKVERVNEEGKKYMETKYREVAYREHQQEASMSIACTYKFISTSTGEVIATNTLYGNVSDDIRYITYNGNKSKFYLAGATGVRKGSSGRRERDRLLSARKTLKSRDVLADEASHQLANQIQSAIERKLQTLIP
jgi:tetratricopeptide (TPR) repeat protein